MSIIKQNQPRRHFTNPNNGRNNRSFSGGRDSTLESSGLAGKIRGTPQQILDKYMNLGRDSLAAGDFVTAESFFQYAEHYRRILLPKEHHSSENTSESPRQPTPSEDKSLRSETSNRMLYPEKESEEIQRTDQTLSSEPVDSQKETSAQQPQKESQDIESLPAFLKPRRSFTRRSSDASTPIVEPLRRRRVRPKADVNSPAE